MEIYFVSRSRIFVRLFIGEEIPIIAGHISIASVKEAGLPVLLPGDRTAIVNYLYIFDFCRSIARKCTVKEHGEAS